MTDAGLPAFAVVGVERFLVREGLVLGETGLRAALADDEFEVPANLFGRHLARLTAMGNEDRLIAHRHAQERSTP